MTRTQIIRAAAAGAFLAVALAPNAAQAATQTANGRAAVLRAIAVTKSTDLNFGTMIAGAAAGTIVITPAGGSTCGATLTCSGTRTAATFTVTGSANQTATLATNATVAITNGTGGTMNVTGMAPSAPTLALGAAGSATFGVGGTLNVGTNQVEGSYTGSFTVTVNYQ